ncbi:MAG: hypothetical protein F4Y27_09405 [Acidimicrobiaceae bacterium]|nr:hypothetical protein [Acidimicrobiaceae bacterium]MYG56043.1 hypothetical protein [Acidimicrobiaceae bacterium]MYK00037.1 hypothetical protein [Acidimicrobiaceae bacterium]
MSLADAPWSVRRGVVLFVGATLLMSGCGGDSADRTDDSSPSAPDTTVSIETTVSPDATAPEPTTTTTTAAPPTTTAAPAITTTTEPPTTTEPERHEEAPLLFDLLVADGEWYPGTAGDVLRATLRSGPGIEHGEVAMITVPRLAIEGTGAIRTDDQEGAWRELKVGHRRTGWVEADRLEINFAAQTSYFDDPCATVGTTVGPAPVSGATGVTDSDARVDHVAQMWHLLGPGCDRLHIAFGSAWDYDSGGPLAAALPEDLTIEAFGTWARISVAGLEAARLDAASEDSWNLTSIVARPTDGTFVIDVYAPQPSLFAAQRLSNPARLLVDVIPAPGTGDDPSAPPTPQLHASSSSFVVWPGELDQQNPAEVALPLTVRGYSSWFESAGIVEIHHSDGTAATAAVTGPQIFNPVVGNSWGVTATGWLESWGTFVFTIDDLEPGEYRLRVGEYPPVDDSEFVGVTIPLKVSVP